MENTIPCRPHGNFGRCVECCCERIAYAYGVKPIVVDSVWRSVHAEWRRIYDEELSATAEVTNDLMRKATAYERATYHIRRRLGRETASAEPPASFDVLCDSAEIPVTIYGLIANSEPSRIRYVGQTINPAGRLRMHLINGSPNVRRWVDQVECSTVISMVRIETTNAVLASEREFYWIDRYRTLDMADLNAHDTQRKRKVAA